MKDYRKNGDFVIRCSNCSDPIAITPHTPATRDLECDLDFELGGVD